MAIELIFSPFFKVRISTLALFCDLINCNKFKATCREICIKPGVRRRLYQSSQSSSSGSMPFIKASLIASDPITCIVPVFRKLLATSSRKRVEANRLQKRSQMSLMNSWINDFGGAHYGFTLLLNNNIKIFVSIYPSNILNIFASCASQDQ